MPTLRLLTGCRWKREVCRSKFPPSAQHREAEHVRLLHYWLNQRAMMSHQPEPFALSEFEIHRVVAEASGNPFLRASSAVLEFGVAVAFVARLDEERRAPLEGLAASKHVLYEAMVRAIERGEADMAAAQMSLLIGSGP
ncbi:MAG: FCD domain-containing protein [Rhodobacterales bacterium]|nr:FCD domain-containing protein [Rhodobacterales bacterium]